MEGPPFELRGVCTLDGGKPARARPSVRPDVALADDRGPAAGFVLQACGKLIRRTPDRFCADGRESFLCGPALITARLAGRPFGMYFLTSGRSNPNESATARFDRPWEKLFDCLLRYEARRPPVCFVAIDCSLDHLDHSGAQIADARRTGFAGSITHDGFSGTTPLPPVWAALRLGWSWQVNGRFIALSFRWRPAK